MKYNWYKLIFLSCSFAVILSSCSKETKVNVYGPPIATIHFSNVSDFIIDSTGKNVAVKAQITSDIGLSQVALVYEPWGLNKVITSFSDLSHYNFNEAVAIPQNAAPQLHSLKLEVTDKKGNISSTAIKIGLADLNYPALYMVDDKAASHFTGNLFGIPVLMNKISSHNYQILYYAQDDNTHLRFIPNAKA